MAADRLSAVLRQHGLAETLPCPRDGSSHRWPQAAEVRDQSIASLRAHAGNGQQVRLAIPYLPSLAVVGHSEAVGLIANPLHQVQYRGSPVEHDRLIFLPVDIDDLLSLGN